MMKELSVLNELLEVDAVKKVPNMDGFWVKAKSPLSVNGVSDFHTQARDYFRISLLYYGAAGRNLRNPKAAIQAPAILLVEKGEIPVYNASSDSMLISLCFSAEFLEGQNVPWNSYLNNSFIASALPLIGSEIKDFHQCFSLLIQEYQRDNPKAPQTTMNLLLSIFKMIADIKEHAGELEKMPPARFLYFRFKALIEQNFKRQHHVQAYADQLCITADMLGKLVRDTVNRTPKQLIDERLITEAKRMLRWTKKTNKEISYDLGFESDSYFNRYFKKHCHQTPLSFRLQMQH